jgi:predicted small integral membrane protein
MNIDLLIISVVVCGYGIWFSLAVFNNIVDFKTNKFLIGKMITMEDIINDPNLGNQLQWRALNGKHWPSIILSNVIAYQLIIAAKLLFSGFTLLSLITSDGVISADILLGVNYSLLMMLTLWFGFLTGGLWFGYWMKMPQVQLVHLLLILITLICLTLVNIL